MTLKELIDTISAIDGIRTMFKQTKGNQLVIIFWRGTSPVASVYVDEDNYQTNYSNLYEMDLADILTINDTLHNFTQTPIEQRQLWS